MVKQKGLGRGLDALLGSDQPVAAAQAPEGDRLTQLPVAMLQPGRYQPRTKMDDEAISELAESLKSQGMIQPILARSLSDGRYEIIAGERRWRAAQRAGLIDVPVLIREVPDESALAMALIENIQREDLNAIEEANGLQRLIDEFGMTHQSAAEAIGRSRSAVTNLLRLLQLPKSIQHMLLERAMEMGHARALLGLHTTQQLELARLIVEKGLSVRETESRAAQMANPPARTSSHRAGKKVDRDVQTLETELSDRLGTKVQLLQGKKGQGRLVIHYGSLDQLDGVLAKLR